MDRCYFIRSCDFLRFPPSEHQPCNFYTTKTVDEDYFWLINQGFQSEQTLILSTNLHELALIF